MIFKNEKAVTLIELFISILTVSIMVLSFYSLEVFSQQQVVNSQRRAKVQNDLSYVLEHMSKYVQQANGNINSQAIVQTGSGLQVRVDLNAVKTPANTNDDAWIVYSISGNQLNVSCVPVIGGSGACDSFTSEGLSDRIIAGFAGSTTLPNPLPENPSAGFYVDINSLGNLINIGLIGRYSPAAAYVDKIDRFKNPQVEMETKVICNSCSVN